MKRREAINIIERAQNNGHFASELDEAVSLALYALKYPDKISCGACAFFVDEDIFGNAWCSKRRKCINCSDSSCVDYE